MTAYRTFTPEDATSFATDNSHLFNGHSQLSCEEFGDGNLNLVFRVTSEKGTSLIVKQALPYARCVGESWPLTTDRARIEAEVLLIHGRLCPEHTVEILHYDPVKAAILMEDLKEYQILRQALLTGKQYLHLAPQLAKYLAHTLFYTSDFVLDGPNKKARVAQFINPDLCLITEDLFFTDPYCNHERNNIHPATLPEAQKLWYDEALQAEVASLKADFLSKPQALLHGDVHSGSIFINEENCKLIDAEFGFYGPIGFDVGSMLGNLLLNYCAQPGLTPDTALQNSHCAYLLQQIDVLWNTFASIFSRLMQQETTDPALQNPLYQQRFIRQIFADAVGYAGTELIRRTVGLAHVADLDTIKNTDLQAACEKNALQLGKILIMQRNELQHTEQLIALIQQIQP
ncbi:S-methyl-5-thioribose kinase [Chromatiaceae bacterium AAb-1]|nr:S-methyl-5-thioribose kinase [Chromatiaceae bacterium AAb-1]